MARYGMFGRDRAVAICLVAGLLLTGDHGLRATLSHPGESAETTEAGLVVRQPLKSDSATAVDAPGVEVDAVTPGGPAAAAGIRSGDVIVRIGGQPVRKPDDLAVKIRGDRETGRVADTLLVRRDGRVYYTVIFLTAR